VRHRQPDQLEPWLARAASRVSEAFQRCAKRLRDDDDSVKAGVTLPWSHGPVEGHSNRLKRLKRQMFGRAKLDVLSRRFLLTSERGQDQVPGQQTPVEAPAWDAAA
jgi:transposase